MYTRYNSCLIAFRDTGFPKIRRKIVQRRVISSHKNFQSIRPRFQFIPLPALSPFSSLGHDASLHRLVNRRKKRGNGESGTDGRKRVSEKGVLGRDIKSSSTGVTRCGVIHPCPQSPPLFSSRVPPDAPSLLFPLAPRSSPLSRLHYPGLPRENPPPFVKGDPTKSPASYTCVQKG